MPTPKSQLLQLTGIRFFLAIWVVVFHQASPWGYLGPWMSKAPELVFCLLRTGYLAVGVFFVLSGFVLSYNYTLEKSWSPSQLTRFAVARFARIYPAYCVGLLLIAPIVVDSISNNLSTAKVGKQAIVAALNWTLLQSWIPQIALSWNSPGWSLSDEAFFYFCFPFLGVALWRISSARSLLLAGALIWGIALVAPLVAVSVPLMGFGNVPAVSMEAGNDPFWPNLIKFNPLLRIPDFCLGILIGRAYHLLRTTNSRLMGRGYWLYIPGLILELAIIANGNSVPYPLFHHGLLLPLHSLVILGFALGGGIAVRLLSVRPLVLLGNASYSMYILHSPVGVWMNIIGNELFNEKPGGLGLTLVYLLIVISLSIIVFKVIEEPANRVLKKALTPGKSIIS